MNNKEIWEELEFNITTCKKCKLCNTRKNAVVGKGNKNSRILFIGEGPGADEDEQGLPFVGRAGKLLDKIFSSVGIKKEEIYITNIIKCRPPQNRVPEIDEISNCMDYLEMQIALLNPGLIVTIGSTATKKILKNIVDLPISKIRGKTFKYANEIDVMPIFHPSYLLRSPSTKEGSPKWLTWQDMQKIKERFESLS